MQDTSHQMKDYLRSYCFSSLDLCQKRNLKNIDLTWATLENNNKFDALHNFSHFQTHYGKIYIFLNAYILLYIMLIMSLQITPSKSASSLNFFFFSIATLAVIVWNRVNI